MLLLLFQLKKKVIDIQYQLAALTFPACYQRIMTRVEIRLVQKSSIANVNRMCAITSVLASYHAWLVHAASFSMSADISEALMVMPVDRCVPSFFECWVLWWQCCSLCNRRSLKRPPPGYVGTGGLYNMRYYRIMPRPFMSWYSYNTKCKTF